jgi:hypothetical protein
MDVARPGPAADVRDTLVVDRDHRDAFGRLAPAAGAAEIVEAALERADGVGRLVQDDHGEHDQDGDEPVRAPELATFCR